MSKRKRHDSLSNASKQLSTQRINDEELNQEGIVFEETEPTVDDNDLKNKKQFSSPNAGEDINVISIDNVNPANSSIPNENNLIKNDNSILRRKSNRILSLKRSIVPCLQNGGSLNSPTADESIPPQSNNAPSSESSSANSSINSSTESAKAIQSTSDPSISSSTISSTSSAQTLVCQTKNIANGNGPTSSTSVPAKVLRKIQAWTEDDTRWFFEALCEHGKDFPHVQAYMATRCEKKNIPSDMVKNYEQVRHYYYRMWHKISQMLNISNVVDKGIQEIYGLINYGEIWKKFGSKFDSKLSANLQQLVDYGYTVFKVKGKSVRVRTPICNALKRIHNINNKVINKPTTPIPKDITVELLPASNADWIRVHSLSQNPRLRTRLTMQHRLSALIAYLERRWSLVRVRENASQALFNTNILDEDNLDSCPSKPKRFDSKNVFSIRLCPQNTEKLREQVQLKSTNNSISGISYRSTAHGNAQIDLSLSSYLNLFNKNDSLADGKKSKIRKSSKKSIQLESATLTEDKASDEGKSKADGANKDDGDQPIDLLKMLDSMNEQLEVAKNRPNPIQCEKSTNNYDIVLCETNNENEFDEKETDADEQESSVNHLPVPPAHTTLAEWLSGAHNSLEDDDINDEETEDKVDGSAVSSTNQNGSPSESPKCKNRRGSFDNANSDLVNLLTAKQARLGWSLDEAQSVTIGELYLLFCCPNKIVLEYSWVPSDACQLSNKETEHISPNEVPNSDDLNVNQKPNSEEKEEDVCESNESPAMSMLQRLLIAANITLANIKKPNVALAHSQLANANSATSSTGQPPKPIRKRTPKSASSQLLSNVIQKTIMNGNTQSLSSDNSNATNEATSDDPNKANASSNVNDATNNPAVSSDKDQFVAPKLPAPRSNQTQAKSSKYRSTAVQEDPSKVEEVLNELKANKYRRQRRPPCKPKPFLYNLHKNQMLTPSKLANGTHSALLLIPASHLTSAEGQTSKQILLSDLLSSHLPQASISLSPAITTSVSVSSLSLSTTSVSSFSTNQHQKQRMLIPLQVETQKVPKDLSIGNSYQQQLNNSTNSTASIKIEPSSSAAFRESNLISILSNANATHCGQAKNQDSFAAKSIQQQSNVPCTSRSVPIGVPKPSTADVLTQSQLSWLNEVNNDFSLGSLIAACDIVANDELNSMNHKITTDTSLAISSDIDTHVSSMANDNSVDLMAKFADLAAQITADSKNI